MSQEERATIEKIRSILKNCLESFHVGREQAVNLRTLTNILVDATTRPCEKSPITSGLVVRAIGELRIEGVLILADNGGYFIASTWDEWTEFRKNSLQDTGHVLVMMARAMGETARRTLSRSGDLKIPTSLGDLAKEFCPHCGEDLSRDNG